MNFKIEQLTETDLPKIMQVMEEVKQSVEVKEWFVADDEAYVRKVLSEKGFIVGAAELESSELAGFFMVYYPDTENNMGTYAGLSKPELAKVVYMDSAAVKEKYRGNRLQQRMLAAVEEILQKRQKEAGLDRMYLMCTVHPDNVFSLRNMEKGGYKIVTRAKMYGGLERYILCKKCCL